MVTMLENGTLKRVSRAMEPIGQATAVDALIESLNLPEDEKRRILATGLRALDGRDDLEAV